MSSYVPTDVGHPLAKSRSIFQYVPYQRIGLFTALTDFVLVFSTSVAAGIIYHAALFEIGGQCRGLYCDRSLFRTDFCDGVENTWSLSAQFTPLTEQSGPRGPSGLEHGASFPDFRIFSFQERSKLFSRLDYRLLRYWFSVCLHRTCYNRVQSQTSASERHTCWPTSGGDR